jgi:hypothetical protein
LLSAQDSDFEGTKHGCWQSQRINRLSADGVFSDYQVNGLDCGKAIPHIFWVKRDNRTVFAEIEATGLIHTELVLR